MKKKKDSFNIKEVLSSIPCTTSDEMMISKGLDLREDYFRIVEKASLPPDSFLLETATGSGRMVSILSRMGYDVLTADIATEINEKVFERITEKYLDRVKFAFFSLEDIPYRDSTIDNIISVNTIHELDNPEKCIDELIRIHSGNGPLILSDFNRFGFDVIGEVHITNYGIPHPEGNMKMDKVFEYLRKYYYSVELFETKLNTTCYAIEKK